MSLCSHMPVESMTFIPLSWSLQCQKTMYYKNETQYHIFTSVQFNPDLLALPTKACKSMSLNHFYIQKARLLPVRVHKVAMGLIR